VLAGLGGKGTGQYDHMLAAESVAAVCLLSHFVRSCRYLSLLSIVKTHGNAVR
jgi:hypothetical protein